VRGYLPSFEMRRARTLDEAVALLSHQPGVWRAFAGGTDLMVLLAAGALTHQRFVDVWGVPELRRIDVTPEQVGIGALATFSDIGRHDVLRREFPLVCAAAREIGGLANQNRATIGGNIANASPAADVPPALLVHDAALDLVSARGRRRVSYERFHRGYKQMDLAPDELIERVWLPRESARRRAAGPMDRQTATEYRKVGARLAQAISKVCFAGWLRLLDGRVSDVRLAFGSVAPTVVRARGAEAVITGEPLSAATVELAAEALGTEISPIDDIRSTALYRARVAANLLRRFLLTAMARQQ
jgi:CO/xanthine dehydrogenase FAD-binding subunit